jgi:uncharacterized membrane protein YfcA
VNEEGTPSREAALSRRRWLLLAAIGLVAGFLSGLFGVGGGILIVPALTLLVRYGPRLASGTSLAAIAIPSVVGAVSYIGRGQVEWAAALLLIVGSVMGAQLGSHLLALLPVIWVKLAFIGFLAASIASLLVTTPARDGVLVLSVPVIAGILATGALAGVLSGLIGVGGGVVVVPLLILVFGVGDLAAKGTSLLMIIPTSFSGTLGNLRRGNVDLPSAAVIGLAACLLSPLGVGAAAAMNSDIAGALFACFLIVVGGRLAGEVLRGVWSRRSICHRS